MDKNRGLNYSNKEIEKKSMNWFASWFDSPYYHILYENRDTKEAEFFIDN